MSSAGGQPASRQLEWHPGSHPWDEHDGFPRHQHSINGALTIDPHDTSLHFAGGKPFGPPTTQWWQATLHFRIPDAEHRVTEGTVSTGIQTAWVDDPRMRREAANAAADRAFRELGLGAIIDKHHQYGARVSIDVSPA